jgi:hypothetical protein
LLEGFWGNDRHLEDWGLLEFDQSYTHSYGKARPYQKQKQKQELKQNINGARAAKTSDSEGCDAEEIYAAYPRKGDRGHAIKAINAAISRIEPREANNTSHWILERAKAYAMVAERAKQRGVDIGRKAPLCATWFNGYRYEDTEQEWNNALSAGAPDGTYPPRRRSPSDRGEYESSLPLGIQKLDEEDQEGGGSEAFSSSIRDQNHRPESHLRLAR